MPAQRDRPLGDYDAEDFALERAGQADAQAKRLRLRATDPIPSIMLGGVRSPV
ncbi:hypothetical protein [Actinoallomurus sp. NPDC052274]|uniref:hypothetical protein n=1 Tax=Actinoallomurus sp. NPDC052274 TaxID=3155420 RepID=UPI003437EC28